MSKLYFKIPISRKDISDLAVSYLIQKGLITEHERSAFTGLNLIGDLEVEFAASNETIETKVPVRVMEMEGKKTWACLTEK